MVSGHATTRPGQPVPGVAPPTRGSPGRRSTRSGLRQRLELLLLLGPAFVLFVGFVLVPIGVAVYYSFFKWSGFGPLNHPIGLGNYRRAFADSVFLHAIQHNVTIALLSLFLQLPLSIGLALLLNRAASRSWILATCCVRSLRALRSRHRCHVADTFAARWIR